MARGWKKYSRAAGDLMHGGRKKKGSGMTEIDLGAPGGDPPDRRPEKKVVSSHYDTAEITLLIAKFIITSKIGLRFGKQVHGGAGYCLSDTFKDGAKDALHGGILQAGMLKTPTHEGWSSWKIRLWNCCAFGLSLGDEGGTAFLFADARPVPTGDRYAPSGEEIQQHPMWKSVSGAAKTFVKVNAVPERTVALAAIPYDTFDAEAVDALYGAIMQKLAELAGNQ